MESNKKQKKRFKIVGFLETSSCLKNRILLRDSIIEVRKYENNTTKQCIFNRKQLINGL